PGGSRQRDQRHAPRPFTGEHDGEEREEGHDEEARDAAEKAGVAFGIRTGLHRARSYRQNEEARAPESTGLVRVGESRLGSSGLRRTTEDARGLPLLLLRLFLVGVGRDDDLRARRELAALED